MMSLNVKQQIHQIVMVNYGLSSPLDKPNQIDYNLKSSYENDKIIIKDLEKYKEKNRRTFADE